MVFTIASTAEHCMSHSCQGEDRMYKLLAFDYWEKIGKIQILCQVTDKIMFSLYKRGPYCSHIHKPFQEDADLQHF